MLTSLKRDAITRVQHEDTLSAHDSGQPMINSTEWLLKKKKMSHLELECIDKPVPVNLSEERGKINLIFMRENKAAWTQMFHFALFHHSLSKNVKKRRKS